MNARTLVVEDEQVVRDLLVAVLRAEGYEVSAAAEGGEALKQAKTFAPDLAVVDVRLGTGPDGFTVARRLREQSDVALLFLTGADEPDELRAGFEAGADLYVTKPFSVDALLVQVEAVLARNGKSRGGKWEVGDLVVDEGSRVVTRGGHRLDLTHVEFELLCRLVRRPGRVLTTSQLLSELWGYKGYSRNVVERHVSALRRKLEEHGPRLIHTVRSSGYVLRG
ncbi:MAG: response regulator transcription factor [Actinobacteria bacterium]|nr:MAG: response regulator transcription factor [Actinomycetota bacterium]